MKSSEPSPYKESKFKVFNKKLNKLSVPVVMKDIKRVQELERYKDEVEDIFVSSEIEDYIGLLKDFYSEFKERISNNLKAKDIPNERVDMFLSNMIENMVVIGDATPRCADTDPVYNCHGWSFGLTKWLELDKVTPENFINELVEKKIQTRLLYSAHITDDVNTFLTSGSSKLQNSKAPIFKSGSIAAYYEKGILMHTSRYLSAIDWYKYDESVHTGWYNKTSMVNFNQDGDCIVENYTSKIGMGYLVVHKVEDIIPLYGDSIEFYDLVCN